MTTADKVIVELQAKIDAYMGNVTKAEKAFTHSTGVIDKSAAAVSARVTNYFKGIGAAYVGLKGAQLAVGLIEANTRITNSLKVAGLAGTELSGVYDKLYASASRNGASFEGLATVYARVSLATKDLGISSARVTTLVDNVAKAIRTSGGDGAAATGALLQLSQAFGSNAIQAQEYNSLIDGLPTLLKAAATGIKEAGGSVAKLTALVKDGKVSNKAFFLGIEAGSHVLDDQLKGSVTTVAQGFENLQTAAIKAAGEIDKSYGISNKLGSGLSTLAGWIEVVGKAFADNAEPIRVFNEIIARTLGYVDAITRAGTATVLGKGDEMRPGTQAYNDALQYSTDPRFKYGRATATPEGETRDEQRIMRKKTAEAISLADNPVLSDKTSTKKTPAQKFAMNLEDERDRIKMLQVETSSIGLNTAAKETNRVQQELLDDARNAGVKLTPEVLDAIAETSTAYGLAAQEAERLAEKQKRIEDGLSTFRDLAQSSLRGFITDLQEGKSATEALGGALGKIADKLIDIAVQNLVGQAFGSLLGGTNGESVTDLGKVVGSFFGGPGHASGTANTGGTRGQPAGIVHGQEAVIPLPNGGRVPVTLSGGASGDIIFAPTLHMPGADGAAVDRAMSELRRMQSEFVPRVRREIVDRGRKW